MHAKGKAILQVSSFTYKNKHHYKHFNHFPFGRAWLGKTII